MNLEQLKNTSLLPGGTKNKKITIPYGAIPLWFLNDDLNEHEIKRQIDEFCDKGISGVMLHPRCYVPKSTPYMSVRFLELYKYAVKCAANNKMKVILYDEAMYPSGAAHGEVVKENSDFSARGLALEVEGTAKLEDTDVIIARYNEDFKLCERGKYILCERYSGGTSRGIHEGEDDGEPNAPKSADLLNPEAVACFIKHTHEKYYSAMSEYFGNTIIAFFTDEPSILGRGAKNGLIPWGKDFHKYYLENGGKKENLIYLFFKDMPQNSSANEEYTAIIDKRLSESFFGNLSKWCMSHDIVLCGHPHESTDIAALENFGIPGQDIVWRYVSPDAPLRGHHSTMGKCSSDAARHRGLARNLNECLGCCSTTPNAWDLSCNDMKWYFDWLFARGVNMLMVHAFFYSTTEKRSAERPPDVGPNSAWWDYYGIISDYIKRYSYLLSESVNQTEIAVLCTGNFLPYEKINAFYENQIEFNYLEEDFLQNIICENGYIKIQNQKYNKIVIEDKSIFKIKTIEKLSVLQKAGIEIIYFDDYTVDKLNKSIIFPKNKSIRVSNILKDERKIRLFFNEGEDRAEFKTTFESAVLFYPFENEFYNFDGNVVLERRGSAVLIEKKQGDAEFPIWKSRNLPISIVDITDNFEGERLGDFSQVKKGFFGRTEYKAKFNIEKIQQTTLDLGEVYEIAAVKINGKAVGVKMWNPYVFDIEKFIVVGKNSLEITVNNPAANKYDKNGAKSGLVGPVKVNI